MPLEQLLFRCLSEVAPDIQSYGPPEIKLPPEGWVFYFWEASLAMRTEPKA